MNQIVLPDKSDSIHFVVQDMRVILHLKNYLKVKIADKLRVVVPNKFIGIAIIDSITESEIILQVIEKSEHKKTNPISLAVPFVRPQSVKKILEIVSCCGVLKLDFFISDKVEKSYLTSKVFSTENIETNLILGLEQGGWSSLPKIEISPQKKLCDFLESDSVVLHPYGENYLEELDFIPKQYVIGPEGGWSDREIDQLKKTGAKTFKLSNSILRVENALTALIAQIELLDRIRYKDSILTNS